MSSAHALADSASFNPFPGLRPFEPDEDHLFFGRERQTDELLRRLRTTRFLSILGRSGSGKSSLVRSGLIPSLYGGGMTRAGSRWRVAIMRPGEDPMGNLAAALSAPDALGDEGSDEGVTGSFFETTLRASQRGLVECIRQSRVTDNVLVLVDQFEELFRYRRSRRIVGRDEAVAFVKLLLAARESEVPCYIAMTMRSDFIGDCMEFGTLPEVVNDGIYLVPRMTRDELRSAITGPVAVGGGTIAPRLVSRLLNDVGDDPDQLPILQHALMRTWERWETDHQAGEGLDLRHYEAIGGLHSALSRHAEEAYAELDPRQQELAARLFTALTDKASDARGVRRPAPLSELAALAGASVDGMAAVIENFRKPGRSFLTPPAGVPLRGSSIIDISHESLMRIWERLSVWADEEARAGQLYLNVARAAQRHEEGTAALWRDPELQLALAWRETQHPTAEWAARYDTAFPRAMLFLDASRDERDREVLEKETRRRQKLRQARMLVLILSTASLITLALGAYAFWQKERAQEEKVQAENARTRAERAQQVATREKVRAEQERVRAEEEEKRAVSEQRRAEDEKVRAEREKVRADDRTVFAESQRRIAETERVNAERNAQEASRQKFAAEKAQDVAVKEKQVADEQRDLAEKSQKETLRLSRLDAARAIALTIPQQKEASEQERSALLALEAYRLNNENQGDPQDPDHFAAMRTALERLTPPAVVGTDQAPVRALAVTPDGRAAFAGSEDGKISRFDLESRKKSAVGSLAFPVRALAIAPEGDRLAAGSAGGELRVWDDVRNAGAPPRELGDSLSVVTAVALGGPLLAAGRLDGTVKVWDLRNPAALPVSFKGAAGKRVMAVAFSADGSMLAAGVAGDQIHGGALLWSLARPEAEPRRLCEGIDVRSLTFRPDGKELACGGARGQIVQQALAGSGKVALSAHRSPVNALMFDKRSRSLASASSDGTVRVWEAGKRDAQPIVLPGHDSWVWAVAFDPGGQRLISGGEDRTVRIWPARAEVLAADLCRAVDAHLTRRLRKELTQDEWTRYMPVGMPYRRGSPCSQ